MMRIAKIELVKYVRGFVILIIFFVLAETFFFSSRNVRSFFELGVFDFECFKVINYYFTGLIVSAIPLTIILTIPNEFSKGYALKLISNGVSRRAYCSSKFIFAVSLAILSTLLYIILIGLFLSIKKTAYFNSTVFINSIAFTFFISLFFFCITVSVALLTRNWYYSLIIYYGYSAIESFIVYQFGQKRPLINYLPFHLSTSVFQLQKSPLDFNDYLLVGSILICFCIVLISLSYFFFKRVDL